MEWLGPYLPALMFILLAILLFSGFPVAFILGGLALAFGILANFIDPWLFEINQFGVLPSRIYGSVAESLILTAVPGFIFMGTMMEKSGVARDLLGCLQILLRRVPGGLALSVTLMGTILAATTGIVGASVVMMSLLALPIMIKQNYSHTLATGTIAASGTLGILIPPSIMLVIMADLLSKSVGNLFVAAVVPGFMLAALYMVYILVICKVKPGMAPMLPDSYGPKGYVQNIKMIFRSFLPPVILIISVLGSILAGFATPTEAAGIGALGSIVLAFINSVFLRKSNFAEESECKNIGHVSVSCSKVDTFSKLKNFFFMLKSVVHSTALTNAMIFGLFVGATLFSFMFRALGGEDQIIDFIEHMGLGPWGFLILVMLIVFLLGFFLDWIEITLIVLPVFAPILSSLDFGGHVLQSEVAYWFAIILAINLQTSFLTPPFGFALFYMKAVAPPDVKMQQIYRGIIPFVLLQLFAVLLVISFPELALWLPRYLLN